MKVNDGNGFFDNDGLIDTLIVDCNNLVKSLAEGQYVKFCNTIVQMVQKLVQLKNGIKNDIEDREKQIDDLSQTNNRMMEQISGLKVNEEEAPAVREDEI